MNQRGPEFGLRMALGAQPRDVLGYVFTQGMKLTLTGIVVGVLCSLGLGKILARLYIRLDLTTR